MVVLELPKVGLWFLLAWALCGDQFTDQRDQMDIVRDRHGSRHRSHDALSLERRQAAREWAQVEEGLAGALALERPLRPGENEEPDDCW